MSEAIRTVGKNGVILDEYKGEFSLTAAYEDKGGTFRAQWGLAQIGKNVYSEKARPFKVILGDKQTAIATLKMLIQEFGGVPDDPDAPF